MFQRIELFNFTVFESVAIDFCNGINVFVGDSGTGKTHVLKAIYAYYDSKKGKTKIPENLEKYFSSSKQNKKNLLRRNHLGQRGMIGNFYESQEEAKELWDKKDGKIIYTKGEVRILFDENGDFAKIDEDFLKRAKQAIFIPAKEMLSHSESLLALERERFIPFDKTLIDIVAKASIGEANEANNIENELLAVLSEKIEGQVICENDVFYVLKKNGLKLEFALEAEGIRKFALLWKLIRNGLLREGAILIWDEPEANINPLLLPDLVDILITLAKNGVQVFLATHEYNLAKYFAVKNKGDVAILYHSFFKDGESVKHSSTTKYKDIENNPNY